ncbi:MAG: hypothetical protein EOP07_02830 [Proteobacteria bacterium]|nr:MAG: hypothetical protein EOP07_02830 [Pseudomonadota bacterium]
MVAGLTKKTLLILALGVVILLAVATRFEDRDVGIALIAGYSLFSLNYIILARIYAGLVQVSQTGVTTPAMKSWLLIGSGIKFLGLIASLYALIVLWKLPGLYIAVGSLLSLILLTSLLVMTYLKSFGSSQA